LILVIGGRSKIGAALIGNLLAGGQQVRALVRAGEPAGRLAAGAASLCVSTYVDGGSAVAILPAPFPQPPPLRGAF